MGRRRLDEKDKKIHVGIRLPKWMVEKIKEKGSVQEVIEKILSKIFKK